MKNISKALIIILVTILISSTQVSSISVLDNIETKLESLSEVSFRSNIFDRLFSFFGKPIIPFPKIPHAFGNYSLLLILIEFDGVPHYPSHNIEYFENSIS